MKNKEKELINSAQKLFKKSKKRKKKKIPKTYKLKPTTIDKIEFFANEYEMNYDQLFNYLLKQNGTPR